jgi:TRAP-type mannitol/chloroaromatic compound transport system substrate-binding protein
MQPIRRREFLRTATVGAVGAGVAGCGADGAATAAAQSEGGVINGPEIEWRVASSFNPSLDISHGAPLRVAERMAALTEGRFVMRVYASGELVPGLQVMDAVEAGTVQAGFTAGYYYIGKHPGLAFDSAVPFGFTARQQNAWLYHGGGLELLREIHSEFGIINFPCGNTGCQMGGWFRQPVNSLTDIAGLRMRIPGIGGEVMARLGASVQVLAGGDIFPALERGAIDATEWVGPHDDLKLGFYQIAPHYYMPGWWEPGPTLTLQVNQRAYDALPRTYQEMLAEVCKEVNFNMTAAYDAANPIALETLVREHGVQLRSFPEDVMEAAWRESNAYLEEQSAAHAGFSKIYASFKEFRERSFPFFATNEEAYAKFAFPKISGALLAAE